MLPNANDLPASFLEQAVDLGVPFSIHINLIRPELGVLFGRPIVIWTTMPIAAIDKDSYTGSRKDDIS
jgi:hypothetical protein